MSKVVIADVDNNMFLKGLINEGTMLKFGVGGKYLGEFPISFNISNMIEVDIISILSNNKNIEIGLNIDETFSKFMSSKDVVAINEICTRKINCFQMSFRRELNVEGVACIQYIYIYTKGILKNYRLKLEELLK